MTDTPDDSPSDAEPQTPPDAPAEVPAGRSEPETRDLTPDGYETKEAK